MISCRKTFVRSFLWFVRLTFFVCSFSLSPSLSSSHRGVTVWLSLSENRLRNCLLNGIIESFDCAWLSTTHITISSLSLASFFSSRLILPFFDGGDQHKKEGVIPFFTHSFFCVWIFSKGYLALTNFYA